MELMAMETMLTLAIVSIFVEPSLLSPVLLGAWQLFSKQTKKAFQITFKWPKQLVFTIM